MAKEQRLIDANVPIRDLTAMKSMYDAISLDGMIKALMEAPTVDAVAVVRCKDCKYRGTDWCIFHVKGEPADEELLKKLDNDFCSCGERRNDGSEG